MGVKLVPKKGGVLVGFRERDASALAALDGCEVVDPRLGRKLRLLGALFGSLNIAGLIPQIEVSAAEHVAVTIRVLEMPGDDDRAKLLAFAAEHDYDFYLQPGGPDSLVPLSAVRPLTYSPDGSRLSLAFQPADFIQINSEVSQRMVVQALDWLNLSAGDEVLCKVVERLKVAARRSDTVARLAGDERRCATADCLRATIPTSATGIVHALCADHEREPKTEQRGQQRAQQPRRPEPQHQPARREKPQAFQTFPDLRIGKQPEEQPGGHGGFEKPGSQGAHRDKIRLPAAPR